MFGCSFAPPGKPMYWAQTVARKSVRLLILLALCVSSAGMATQSAHAALPVMPGARVAQGEGDPTITIGGALGAFASFAGAPSDEQSYTVAGTDLTDPIVIAPPAGFQISLTSGSGWVSHPDTINLSPTDGTVVSTTIYVRFNRATIGSSSGDITHTSAGAVATNMPVSGAASNAAPLITEGDSIGVVMSEDSEPTAFSLTLNATDANPADTLTWSILTAATNGVANASGTGAFKAIGYTPTPDYRGNDSFVVQVSDDNGGSDTITVNVTIDPINDPPILDPICDQSINELETLTLTFTGSDPDQPIDKLAFCSSGGPAGSSLVPDTGVFTWTPTEAQGPGAYILSICISDPYLSDWETITVTVNEVNTAPVLGVIGDKSVDELATLSFTATATDNDLPANTLTFSLTGAPAGAGIHPSSGAFSWTPTEAQGPGAHTFDVCVYDGTTTDCETITVTVNEVNTAPVLGVIGNKTVDELVALSFTATATDNDLPANTLTFSLTGAPAGAGIHPSSGAFSWTPTEAQGVGVYTFDVCISDGTTTDCETITVTVNEVNGPPALNPIGAKSVNELAALSFTASATDNDPGATLAFNLANGASGLIPTGAGINPSSGAFSWTPTEAQGPGTHTFDVCVSDGLHTVCETITVTVNEINTAPTASEDAYSTLKNITLNVAAPGLLSNDLDQDLPANTLTTFIVADLPEGEGVLALAGDGGFSYTPPVDWTGTTSFTYRITDGLVFSEPITVSLYVYEINEQPTDISLSIDIIAENLPTNTSVGAFSAIDPNTGDQFTYALVAGSGDTDNPSFTIDGSSLRTNEIFDFETKNEYSIRMRTTDQWNLWVEKSFTIYITNVNETPAATPQTLAATEDNSIAITLAGTDIDGDTLDFVIVNQPAKGVLTGTAPNLTYTPNAHANGADSFTFRAEDAGLGSPEATVAININAVNDAPVNTIPGSQTIYEDTSLVFLGPRLISVGDVDVLETVDGKLDVTLSVAHGVLSLSQTSGLTFTAGDGSADTNMTFRGAVADINAALLGLTFTPVENYNGADTLTIVIKDLGNTGSGGQQTDTDTVAITITPVDDGVTVYLPLVVTTNP